MALFLACSPILIAQAPPPSSDAEALRQELRQLKSEYEQRIQSLEERLKLLESSPAARPAAAPSAKPVSPGMAPPPAPAPTAAPIPPGEPAKALATPPPVSSREMNRQFLHPTESRERALYTDRPPWRERAEEVLEQFLDITGYFRAGYGRSQEGGPQVAFQAPGAFAKYRLGNEAENYGELGFGKSFYVPNLFKLDEAPPEGMPTGPIARVQTRISIYNPYEDLLSSASTDFGLPEAWGAIGNVVPAQPGMNFWAGSRFYRRHDIHINDFYFYNMSGTGGGVEDFQLPFGKLALAWLGAGATSGFSDLPQPDPNNKAGFSKGSADLRLYDVPLPLGKGEFGFVFSRTDSGRDSLGNQAEDSQGVSFTALHTADNFISEDGVNKVSLQFGTGAASTFTSGFETFTLTNGVFIRPLDEDVWRFRATEHFTANLGDYFSFGPALVYQLSDYGDNGGRVHWASAGLRPIVHFNRFLNLAFEAGVDWVKDEEAGTSDYLTKITLAPQVSLGRRFMSRPVIRAFITYAHWGDDFQGSVAGPSYPADKNYGITYGAQMEAWW